MVAAKKTTQTKLEVPSIGIDGKASTSIVVPEELFGVNASEKLLAQYVRVYLANQRQGSGHAKTRSEVRGTTKKVWRQKGTGRARHGARTAPIFVGGGVTFGPRSRSFKLKLNKKQRRKALYYSLSLKLSEGTITIANNIDDIKGKTKDVEPLLKKLKEVGKGGILFVYALEQADSLSKTLRNVKGVDAVNARQLNAYDVLKANQVVFSQEALKDFMAFRGYEKTKATKSTPSKSEESVKKSSKKEVGAKKSKEKSEVKEKAS